MSFHGLGAMVGILVPPPPRGVSTGALRSTYAAMRVQRARQQLDAGADPFDVWLHFEALDADGAGQTFGEFMQALQDVPPC